jgi:hypothetical protein
MNVASRAGAGAPPVTRRRNRRIEGAGNPRARAAAAAAAAVADDMKNEPARFERAADLICRARGSRGSTERCDPDVQRIIFRGILRVREAQPRAHARADSLGVTLRHNEANIARPLIRYIIAYQFLNPAVT